MAERRGAERRRRVCAACGAERVCVHATRHDGWVQRGRRREEHGVRREWKRVYHIFMSRFKT